MSQMRRFVIGLHQDDALLLDKTGVSRLGWLRAGAIGLVLVGLLIGGSETAESKEGIAEADVDFLVGMMYRDGTGVAQDDAEAAKWFLMAAEQGHANAKRMLEEHF